MFKKVLVLASGNYVSGAEKITLDVIAGLKEQGHLVHCMVSGWNDGKFIARLSELKVNYSITKLGWYYFSKIRWSLDSFLHYPKAIVDFSRIKKKFQPDLVYTNSYRQIVLLYPFLNKKIVYHVHDSISNSNQSKFFLRLIDKKIQRYIAVSQSIKKDLEAIGIETQKIEVIYNGVDLPLNRIRTSFDEPRIGIIGQLIYRKGHMVLLKAVKILKEKYQKRFVVYVIGSGDENYRRELMEYTRENNLQDYVQFKGHIGNSAEIYSSIDYTVIPSFSEAFGLIAVESYFNKIPVIASRVGGLEEIVLNAKTGYLFAPGNADELADKINLFLDDPHQAQKMGEEGFDYCSTKFLKNTMLNELNSFFNKISGRSSMSIHGETHKIQ